MKASEELAELIAMLKAAVVEDGCTIFDHSAEEFGLVLMTCHAEVLSALEAVEGMREALEKADALAAECPLDSRNIAVRRANYDRCTICGAGRSDACGRKSEATYNFTEAARQALALKEKDGE